MAKVKYYLKDKNLEQKTAIRLYFNYNNEVFKYSTKLSIEPRKWDSKTCRVKSQANYSIEYNRELNVIADEIMKIYLNLKNSNEIISKNILKDRLDIALERTEQEDFFSYTKIYLEQRCELKYTTKRDYLQTYNTLKEFETRTGYIVSFESINLDFYNRFKHYILNTLNHSINTFGKRIKIIKSILNYATEIGVNKNTEFLKKGFKVLSEKKKHQYLTVKEIENIRTLELKDSLDKSRDIFLLMCYLGLRFSDYPKITRNNINEDNLDILMQKTNSTVSIPIHPNAMKMIQKWDYSLPYQNSNTVNQNIKKICKLAEINNKLDDGSYKYENISCHTGRRSFATNGYLNNVPIRELMLVTGHKKESTFMNYVQIKREVKMSRILEVYPTLLRKVI
ncbi:MAG: site-specific integrase [Flavobacteriales bacterium]|nr:site-specific integrase [Flavobacteriales bacterium]